MILVCPSWRPLLLVAWLAASAAGSDAWGQRAAATAPSPPAPAAPTAAVTQPQPIPLVLEAGRGALLRLPQPAITVMAADPAIARVQPASPTSLFIMGVAGGRTTVIATADTGAAVAEYDVTVKATGASAAGRGAAAAAAAPAAAGATAIGATAAPEARFTAAAARSAQDSIAQLVPGAAGVRVTLSGDGVHIAGVVPNAAIAQQVEAIVRTYLGPHTLAIDEMTVLSSITVNVRVRFAEISRSITRELGFNWQALRSGSNWRFGLLTGAARLGRISPLLPLGLNDISRIQPDQIGAGFQSGPWDVNGIIDALATDQLITILAEPNLTAQSGETASFLAGGEFPVPVAGNSVDQITIQFKQFGISLAVVPTVLSPDRLNLRVRPEVSELSTNGAITLPLAGGTVTVPALTVRRAETTIELGSGQSFAIAGLLSKTTTDQKNALPGLNELPVLGPLFRSTSYQRGETELVILVTPYLVKPAASPDQLRTPMDGFVPATDLERILLGRQIGAQGKGQRPVDAGFILR